jgi:hypothetical protein
LKQPTVELQTAENCGQMLNYFHAVHDKQPHRSLFVTILSNLSTTWVYIAMLDKDGPNIHEYHCESLAEAVVFTDMTSKSQFKTNLPHLDSQFESNYNVLTIGTHYFLLSVINLPSAVLTHTSDQNNGTAAWN